MKKNVAKRILAAVLVIVMAAGMCACGIMDYKKAQALYEDGDYEDAREIFEQLGDYEDAEQMVMACDYGMAEEWMDDGEYLKAGETFEKLDDYEDSEKLAKECYYTLAEQYMDEEKYTEARELYVKLGDYEDSEEKAATAARWMVIEYIGEDDYNEKIDSTSATMIWVSEEKLYVGYAWKTTGAINISLAVGAQISPDGSAFIVGTDESSSYAANYKATASGSFDLSTYKNGDKLTWSKFDVNGTNAQGKPYTQSGTMLNIMPTSAMTKATSALEAFLEESGLGLTMQDLGFLAY